MQRCHYENVELERIVHRRLMSTRSAWAFIARFPESRATGNFPFLKYVEFKIRTSASIGKRVSAIQTK